MKCNFQVKIITVFWFFFTEVIAKLRLQASLTCGITKKEKTLAVVSGDDRVITQGRHTHLINATTPQQIMQRWQIVQGHLIPALHQEIGLLTPKLEKLIHILEWSRIEEFVTRFSYRTGRPAHELA